MDLAPIDMCSYAALVALQCTSIPRTEMFLGESGLPEDFEVCGDIGDAVDFSIVAAANTPVCVTIYKVFLPQRVLWMRILMVPLVYSCCPYHSPFVIIFL